MRPLMSPSSSRDRGYQGGGRPRGDDREYRGERREGRADDYYRGEERYRGES